MVVVSNTCKLYNVMVSGGVGIGLNASTVMVYLYGLCVAAQSAEGGDERKQYLFHCFCIIVENCSII